MGGGADGWVGIPLGNLVLHCATLLNSLFLRLLITFFLRQNVSDIYLGISGGSTDGWVGIPLGNQVLHCTS